MNNNGVELIDHNKNKRMKKKRDVGKIFYRKNVQKEGVRIELGKNIEK